MAFIFVPNAEGGFDEGDRQTNPDTGVEYIYLDGAWRALGPDISDEFPELDERYLRLSGGTMTGGLQLANARNLTFRKQENRTNQFAINPNISVDYYTNIYAFNGDGMRFRVSQDQSVGNYDTLIALSGETQTIGDTEYRGTAYINRVRTPYNDDHAANKWYVDNAIDAIDVGDIDLDGYATEDYVDSALASYLPLSGGTVTGRLNLNNTSLYVFDGDDSEKFRIQPSGFCRTYDLFRSERTDNGPALQARNNGTLNAEIRCNGRATFKESVKKDGKELATEEHVSGSYLPLSGGTLTGTLTGQLIKSIRNSGYAFEVKPDNGDTVALIRSAGTSSFKGVTIDSLLASGAERPFEIKGRLSDGTTVSKNFFYVYANNNGTASAINYDGKMDSEKNIVNKGFVDNKVPGRFTFEGGALYYNT